MGKKKAVVAAPASVSVLERPVLEQVAKAPPSREQLAAAVRDELVVRSKRCMTRIEAILREENCLLEAQIRLPEVSPGVFGIAAEPGVRAL